MTDKQKLNKPLFSQHFLDYRLQECPEWQIDAVPGFEALQNLYSSKRDLLPTLNEAQTEEIFIKRHCKIGDVVIWQERRSRYANNEAVT